MPTDLERAVAAQQLWKPGPCLRAACELIRAGLNEYRQGRSYFGCDNVREEYEYEGSGICGVATRMLLHAGLIEPSPQGRRKSLRKSAHGRRVDLYSLRSISLAESFMRKHDPSYVMRQVDWIDEMKGVAQ